jgi:hypothetical protein
VSGVGGQGPQDAVRLAGDAAESVRVLGRVLLDAGPAAFGQPDDMAALLEQLRVLVARLPEALLLAEAWLETAQLRGHIGHDSCPPGSLGSLFTAAEGVVEVGDLLRQAQGLARQLTSALGAAHEECAHLRGVRS